MTAKSTDIPRFDDTEEDTREYTNMSESDSYQLQQLTREYGYGELIRTLGIWLAEDRG